MIKTFSIPHSPEDIYLNISNEEIARNEKVAFIISIQKDRDILLKTPQGQALLCLELLIHKFFKSQGFLTVSYTGSVNAVFSLTQHIDYQAIHLERVNRCISWLNNSKFSDFKKIWCIGIDCGTYINMQLAMRRTEVEHFININTPVDVYDFTFLSPCLCPGIFFQSTREKILNKISLKMLGKVLSRPKNLDIFVDFIGNMNAVEEFVPADDESFYYKGYERNVLQRMKDYIDHANKIKLFVPTRYHLSTDSLDEASKLELIKNEKMLLKSEDDYTEDYDLIPEAA